MNRARILSAAVCIAVLRFASGAHATDMFTVRHAEHFGGSALIAGVATDLTHSEATGFAIALAVGFTKECVDQTNYPRDGFTLKSLIADAAGAYLGAKVTGLAINPSPHGFSVTFEHRF